MPSKRGADEVFCTECGEVIKQNAVNCPYCGVHRHSATTKLDFLDDIKRNLQESLNNHQGAHITLILAIILSALLLVLVSTSIGQSIVFFLSAIGFFALIPISILAGILVVWREHIRESVCEHFSFLPGFDSKSKIRSGIATFSYLFLISMLLFGVSAATIPPDSPDGTNSVESNSTPTPTATPETHTTSTPTPTSELTPTETATPETHTTSTPTLTPEPRPTETATPEPTPTVTPESEENYPEHTKRMQQSLNQVVTAPDVRYTGSHIQVDYISTAESSNELGVEIAVVIGAYTTEIAEEDMEPIRLEARILSMDGEAVGKYHIKKEWGEKYQSGEYTVSDVTEETSGTLEVVEE